MAFVMKIKGKEYEIKFDYRLMFKANNKLSTVDDNGRRQENGAGQLFMDVVERKDSAVHNIIELAYDKKLTENEIIEAVIDYSEEHGYEKLFEVIEQEMIDSDFFMPKIEKLIEDMKFGKELLKDTEDKQEQAQLKAVESLINRLQKKIS